MDAQQTHVGLVWKIRRLIANYRLQDVSSHCAISMTRLRAIEHGEAEPTDLDRRLVENFLPPLPPLPRSEVQRPDEAAADSP
jgi:hypothetical protein